MWCRTAGGTRRPAGGVVSVATRDQRESGWIAILSPMLICALGYFSFFPWVMDCLLTEGWFSFRFTVCPRPRTARRDQPAFKIKSILKGSDVNGAKVPDRMRTYCARFSGSFATRAGILASS